jgi:hypothetical protein
MSSRFGGAGCYETCENLWVTIKFGDFVWVLASQEGA